MKLLGKNVHIVNTLVCVVVGILIGYFVLCGCSKTTSKKEAFRELGANLKYNMAQGVPGLRQHQLRPPAYTQQLNTHTGPTVPLPEGQLFFFADTDFTPECCVPPYSGVSSSDGCACVTKEQVDYINMRGGNRSPFSAF